MSIRKALLMASMALAAIAFAVPVAASAEPSTWTNDHEHIEGAEEVEQSFEGTLKLQTPFGSITCTTTLTIQAGAGSTARVTEFKPTTLTCEGTGIYPPCILVADTSNLPWDLHAGTLELTATNGEEDLELDYHFKESFDCPITTLRVLFSSLRISVELDENGTIKSLGVLKKYDTSGTMWIKGTLEPEFEPTLGLT